MHLAMRHLLRLGTIFLRCIPAFFRSRNQQALVEFALRQQLATHGLKGPKARIAPVDRAFWVFLSRIWPGWKEALVIVQHSQAELNKIALRLNQRPRKTLNFRCPADKLSESVALTT